MITAGVLIPAFSTFKSLRNKTQQNRLIWLRYWVVFSLFYSSRLITDIFLFWLPFYNIIKILFILWLSSSRAAGAQVLYFYAVDPILRGHEAAIDRIISYYQKKLTNLCWTVASQIGVRWSGFFVQVIRLYLETAVLSAPNSNSLSIDESPADDINVPEAMETNAESDITHGTSQSPAPNDLDVTQSIVLRPRRNLQRRSNSIDSK